MGGLEGAECIPEFTGSGVVICAWMGVTGYASMTQARLCVGVFGDAVWFVLVSVYLHVGVCL